MVPNPHQSANPCRGLCWGAMGSLVGTGKDQHLTFSAAEMGAGVSEPPLTAPLPAIIALPSDTGSFALAINGAACCLATSDPAIVSVQCQLLSGVKSQRVGLCIHLRGIIQPLKTSLPAVFGLVFFTVASPFLSMLLMFSNLEFLHFWP